jgi:hypothetical protein
MELLEREPFLATLAEYAADARQGSGRLVLVYGESGIGKTALLEAFQRRSPELRWLWGGCERLITPRPLGPLFDIAAQASGELASLATQAGAPRERLFAAFLAEIGAGPASTGPASTGPASTSPASTSPASMGRARPTPPAGTPAANSAASADNKVPRAAPPQPSRSPAPRAEGRPQGSGRRRRRSRRRAGH